MIIYPIVPAPPVVAGVVGVGGLFERNTPGDDGGLLNWDHEFPNIETAPTVTAPTYDKTVKVSEGP